MNDIKLKVSVETSDANRRISEFTKDAEKLKQTLNEVGKSAQAVGKGAKAKSIGDPMASTFGERDEIKPLLDSIKGTTKEFTAGIRDLTKAIENFVDRDRDRPSSARKEVPTAKMPTSTVTPKTEIPTPQKGMDLQNLLPIGAIGLFLGRYFRDNANRSRDYESSALDVYARTGAYGRNLNQGRVDAHRAGVTYGYGLNTTMQTQDTLLQGGFKDISTLEADTTSLMQFSKVYGISPSNMADNFAKTARSGAYGLGQGEDYARLLSASIHAGGMTGREQEQINTLNELVDIFTNGKISVESEDFRNIASIQMALGNVHESLKGQRGAEIIKGLDNVINPHDDTTLRMLSLGTGMPLAGSNIETLMNMAYKGLSDPTVVEAFFKGMEKMNVSPDSWRGRTFLSERSPNVSPEQFGAIYEAYQTMGANEASKLFNQYNKDNPEYKGLWDNIEGSKALAQERMDINVENARIIVGNMANEVASPFRQMFNSLPTPLQSGLTLGADVGTNVIKGLGLGAGIRALGGSGLSTTLGNVASSAGGVATKALGAVGKYAPFIGAGIQGIEGVYKFSQGDSRGGVSAVGGGLGGLAGAKAGAMLGTAIMPGVGTAIGGGLGFLGGSLGGRFLGGKAHDFFTPETAHASKNLAKEDLQLNKKDALLDKEEDLVDRLLAFKGDKPVPKKGEKSTDPYESDALEKMIREQYGDEAYDYYLQRIEEAKSRETEIIGQPKDSKPIGNIKNLPKDTEKELQDLIASLPEQKQKLIHDVLPGAIENYQKHGIFPSVTLGQSALESNWGESDLTTRNNAYFGIKADSRWNGAYVNMPTGETINGKKVKINANFRAYDNPAQSVTDHGDFLKNNPRYTKAGLFDAKDAQGQLQAIEKAGYATTPGYAGKTSQVIKDSKFDDIEKLILQGLGRQAPSYAVGVDRVDRDKKAYIHKDEAILNKHDAKQYRERGLNDPFSQERAIDRLVNVNENRSSEVNVTLKVDATQGVDQELVQQLRKMLNMAIGLAKKDNSNVNLRHSFDRVPV